MLAIEINGLTKGYRGKRGRKIPALTNLNLQVEEGEVFGFLGPNGAGKSTTIRILVGLIRASAGQATLFGVDYCEANARNRIGYLPENPAFYDFLSAREYLQFVGKTFNMNKAILSQRIDEILERFDLIGASKRPIRGFSKGMVQRLGLAQALVHDPDLYILDEPMSGLDPVGRALVKKVIGELKKKGKTVFFSSHITADMEAICDRVGVILNGKLQTVERIESILLAGVESYRVLFIEVSCNEQKQILLDKEQLSHFVATAEGEGRKIVLIEPCRKDLESYFLDIVKG